MKKTALQKICEKHIGNYSFESYIPLSDDDGVQNAMKEYAEYYFNQNYQLLKTALFPVLIERGFDQWDFDAIVEQLDKIEQTHF